MSRWPQKRKLLPVNDARFVSSGFRRLLPPRGLPRPAAHQQLEVVPWQDTQGGKAALSHRRLRAAAVPSRVNDPSAEAPRPQPLPKF